MSDNSNELEEVKKLAEFHAYSVRQLIAQRTRILQVTQTAGSVAKFDNGTDILAVLKQIETSPSQYFQDIYCLLLNRGKREGFFVEFGACDGMLLSNTWALESEFGWRGILSEPMPSWHQALKKIETALSTNTASGSKAPSILSSLNTRATNTKLNQALL
jgi:hypothetical protein